MSESAGPRFHLERWFASLPRPARCDLTSSGAPELSLRALLAVATSAERAEFERLSLGYGPGQGSVALRTAIAGQYPGGRAEHVLATCGAIEALHLVMAALVRPGNDVVVQDPMYPAVADLAAVRGAHVVRWPIDDGDGYRPTIERLVPFLTPRTRLVAITQPNGPTGSLMEAAELRALRELLDARGIWLLSDEVYRDLALEPGLHVPTAFGGEHAIVVGDMAKPFGLGGLRVGWLVARSRTLLERATRLRDYTTLSVPTTSDLLARIALAHGDAIVADAVRMARENLARLVALAARDHVLSVPVPRAGVTAFVGVRDATALQRALARDGVLVVPGALFGRPDRLRVGLAVPEPSFAGALDLLRCHVGESAAPRGSGVR